jgi:hypothetical protein
LVSVADWPSVLVTTTFHGPVAAPVRLKVQVILVEETRETLVPLISVWPLLVSLTVTPVRKPVPARLVMLTLPLFSPELGVMLVIVGAGVDVAV